MIQTRWMKQQMHMVDVVSLRQGFQHPPVLPQRLMRIDVVQRQLIMHAEDEMGSS